MNKLHELYVYNTDKSLNNILITKKLNSSVIKPNNNNNFKILINNANIIINAGKKITLFLY